ncbi:hypothetical protein G7046_g4517 [Stylonectria norvegica]|nr:hypothetical protein G7046_g4517 [Stylonectria norvegica]
MLFLRAAHSFDECTEVSDICPVSATVLGYYPSLGASIFFALAFGVLTIAAGVLGVWKRTWTFGVAITIGLLLECLGYVGRALLHSNPWNQSGFELQICCIIIAPTFICVSIYLTLKHISLNLNPALSRIQPKWYPRIFLPADLSCLVIQAIGGGVATAAGKDQEKVLKAGNDLIIAGICLQVAVLIGFGIMAGDYLFRAKRYMSSGQAQEQALALWQDSKFRRFGFAVTGAYAAVLVRCVYRIAEMAGGWGNYIMQDEASFMVLDSSLVLVAGTLLTVFHPGLLFPQMANGRRQTTFAEKSEVAGEDSNGGAKV